MTIYEAAATGYNPGQVMRAVEDLRDMEEIKVSGEELARLLEHTSPTVRNEFLALLGANLDTSTVYDTVRRIAFCQAVKGTSVDMEHMLVEIYTETSGLPAVAMAAFGAERREPSPEPGHVEQREYGGWTWRIVCR